MGRKTAALLICSSAILCFTGCLQNDSSSDISMTEIAAVETTESQQDISEADEAVKRYLEAYISPYGGETVLRSILPYPESYFPEGFDAKWYERVTSRNREAKIRAEEEGWKLVDFKRKEALTQSQLKKVDDYLWRKYESYSTALSGYVYEFTYNTRNGRQTDELCAVKMSGIGWKIYDYFVSLLD